MVPRMIIGWLTVRAKGRPNRCSVLVRRLACYEPNVDFCELGCQRAELPARRQRNRSHEAVETFT
jgi:hypothetical protein